MEAPEKIYLFRHPIGVILDSWYLNPNAPFEKIEYIHKDAFIEKACEWLKDNTDRYLYNTGGIDEYIPKCGGKMINDFKKYMEK